MRFYIEATWGTDGVEVRLDRVEPRAPEEVRRTIGELVVPYPDGGFQKRVRRAALDYLAEHEGMTDADSFEIQYATHDGLEVLAQIEALVSAG